MIKKNIPNTITLLNLFCGCMAIVAALNLNIPLAFSLVVAAMVFDFLDGFAARLLKAYSELGKQLDSLADLVSFGVAPAMMLYVLDLEQMAFLITIFSAVRLAKFNIDSRQSTSFIGLPTPACAIFFCSISYIISTMKGTALATFLDNQTLLSALVVIFSYLLVAEIPMFSLKFKSFKLSENYIVYTFLLLSLVALIIYQIVALPFIIVAYLLISILRNCLNNIVSKSK